MNESVCAALAEKDPMLAPLLSKVELSQLPETKGVFHDLMSCILEQQIHCRSTKNIFSNMLKRAGLDRLTLENFEHFEEHGIAQTKLSANKCSTLASTLDFFASQKIDWSLLSDGEVRQTLGQIKGIGPWTQDMILLYPLRRPNIVPLDDYHLKKLMVKFYGLNPKVKLKARMREISALWTPYGSTATLALFEWKARHSNRS